MNREHIWQPGIFPESVISGSTTKAFGVFRLERGVPAEQVLANREAFAQAIGVPLEQFVLTHQVHGSRVVIVDEKLSRDQWWEQIEADALVTSQRGVVLLIKTADCVPVFLYDQRNDVIGLAHAGWRGIAADVIGATISNMAEVFKTSAKDLLVSIGPAICVNHYDVTQAKDDRLQRYEHMFGAQSQIIQRKNGQIAQNLPAAAKELCLKRGVSAGNIELSGVCTYENPGLWASYRREGEQLTHDIWSFILIQ